MHCLWSELLLSRNILISLSPIKKFLLTNLKWLAFLKGCDENNVINLKVLSINYLKNKNLKHEKKKPKTERPIKEGETLLGDQSELK